VTDLLRLRIAVGMPPGDLDGVSDRCARAVAVATSVGAPILDAVDGAAAAEDDMRRARRAVTVASAQTRTVAAGLLAAPVLLVPGLGRLVGADLLGFYTTAAGVLVLAVGGGLMALGAGIVAMLVRRVGRRPPVRDRARRLALVAAVAAGWLAWRVVGPALVPLAAWLGHRLGSRRHRVEVPPDDIDEAADLAATALAGGVAVPQALRVAAHQLPELARPLHRLAFELELGLGPTVAALARSGRGSMVVDDGFERLRSVLVTATAMGAPVVATLRRLATDLRAEDLSRVLAAAERLPAQLTFPTALCLLPATVLLVGAPIVHAGVVAAGV